MARIRSVHPGLWTDERFASVSMAARLLFIGLWNECDDHGSFEWSPIKLKMRILPADNVDACELLAELEAVGSILGYELDGRRLGAVRNFTLYQRPKKPNSVYLQTDEVRNFVGLKGDVVRNEFPTGGEKAPQMEEGGGRRSSVPNGTGGEVSAPEPEKPPADPEKVMFDAGLRLLADAGMASARARPVLGRWRRDHGSGAVIEALAAAQRQGAIDPVSFIEGRFRSGKTLRPAEEFEERWLP